MASPTASTSKQGFTERGHQVTRLEAFVDAAFAFAVTLLVISFDDIPSNAEELISAFKTVPAFAASFAMVAMFWYAHNTWSRRYGLDDSVSIWLSLLLVFLILVYVFPLRLLFASFFALATQGWLPSDYQIQSIDDLRLMFITYACSFISLCGVTALHYRRARRCADALNLNRYERTQTLAAELHFWLMAAIGLISLILAILLNEDWPGAAQGAPGMVYFMLWTTETVAGRIARNRAA